jgi:hypothetical protein
MPAENRVGFDDGGDFLQDLLPQLLADHGQGFALAVAQPEAPLDLAAEDTIFRHEILIAQ